MGKQIRFAFSEIDESKLIFLLNYRYSLYCLPRIFFDPNPSIERFELGQSKELVIFGTQFLENVQLNITKVVGKEDSYHVFPRASFCIEFVRSVKNNEGLFNKGRFYLPDKDDQNSESRKFIHLFKAI